MVKINIKKNKQNINFNDLTRIEQYVYSFSAFFDIHNKLCYSRICDKLQGMYRVNLQSFSKIKSKIDSDANYIFKDGLFHITDYAFNNFDKYFKFNNFKIETFVNFEYNGKKHMYFETEFRNICVGLHQTKKVDTSNYFDFSVRIFNDKDEDIKHFFIKTEPEYIKIPKFNILNLYPDLAWLKIFLVDLHKKYSDDRFWEEVGDIFYDLLDKARKISNLYDSSF